MTVDQLFGVPVVPLAEDAPPLFDNEPEFTCQMCGIALEYGGRGRKPKYCDAHRRRSASTGTRSATAGSNDKLAAMAVDVLCQGNAAITVGLMLVRLNQTASELATRDDAFRAQAYEALKLDPALCKVILKGGASSGKVALMIAYAMMLASVAPTFISEMKERRATERADDE